jgi:hypothetical protein
MTFKSKLRFAFLLTLLKVMTVIRFLAYNRTVIKLLTIITLQRTRVCKILNLLKLGRLVKPIKS